MTRVKSHGNNVHDIMIAYVISRGAQTNRSGEHLCVVKAWVGYCNSLFVIYFECLYYPP